MCQYCKRGQPDNIVSVSAPGFWVKVKIELGKLVFAYDMGNNGMRQVAKIHFCPFCGEKLDKEG